ncbi:hypothetical protein [Micromonospora sp. KC213]|uniref:hypothetical protein n=1 Tax=Micromonospora sp. KC213 TaxID=2530378 RepID=UPI0010527BAC|nr:hypothetical protein [Micromonospora sp. KC213]TDC37098.1 hypothetical protein E1166_20985 [Micromonospora sp. KC213]
MHRYYVSFSYQAPSGFAVASVDVTARQRFATVNDLAPVTADLTGRGYRNVTILAFSLYANPTRDNDTHRNPNPNRDTRRAPHTSPRPNPRGRRS